MAKAPGGSFIPKKSSGRVAPKRSGRRIYVLSYIAYIFFFGTLLSVGGIFFLNQQAESQLAEHIDLLEQERQAFREGQLQEVRQLDRRLNLAERILNAHAAPSLIFDALEPVAVETVQFDQFNYSRNDNGGVTVSIGGITESFDILLFQRQVIEESELLASADFINVQYGGAANEIEGANRGPQEVPDSSEVTQVTFTFEDSTVLESIGYQPRQGGTSVGGGTQAQQQADEADATGTDGVSDTVNTEQQ